MNDVLFNKLKETIGKDKQKTIFQKEPFQPNEVSRHELYENYQRLLAIQKDKLAKEGES